MVFYILKKLGNLIQLQQQNQIQNIIVKKYEYKRQ